MPTIVYQTNRQGIKYAYESISYWDKDKKAPRSKRRYLGKVDPETGEIIPPKGKRDNRIEKSGTQDDDPAAGAEMKKLRSELARKDREIESLRKELDAIREKHSSAMDAVGKIFAAAAGVLGDNGS